MKRALICIFSVLFMATVAEAAPITYDFGTSPLVNSPLNNNEPSIVPVLAELQSMGLTLTTVGGLGFNVGCGDTSGNCLGADQTVVNGFDGQIHGVLAVPSSIFGIHDVIAISTVNLYGAGGAFIGSYSSNFNYIGSTPVSSFDVFLNYDGIYSISWDSAPAPVPEPASLLLLGTGLVGAVRAVRRKRS